MKASRNELIALFKQAFEGVGFDLGGYENAADMIIWAQMHGLNSFDVMRKRMADYQQRKELLREQLTPKQLNADSDENAVIDAKNNSSIVAAGMAFYIAYVKAIKSTVAKVNVLNCFDRKLTIKKLVDCAKRGMVCLAYWRDGATLHVVTSDTGVCCPEYRQYSITALSEQDDLAAEQHYFSKQHQQTLFVVCANNAANLQEYITHNLPELESNQTSQANQSKVISPAMMKSSYIEALTNGIDIDPSFWQELATLGTQVLVESTEQSRMGAGA